MGVISIRKDVIPPGRIIRFIAISSIFLFFFISLLRIKVSNEDFWWHLATGKYIVETQSLPQNDPFLFTSSDSPSQRKEFLLKGYWLSQVVFYQVYSLWDLKGIIVLRALFLLVFLYCIFLAVRTQDVPDLASLLTVSGVFWYTLIAEGERPQLFTFIVFSLVYYFIEDYRKKRSKKVYAVPILILVLSNMHPGYVICFALLSLYLAGEAIRYISKKGRRDNVVKGLFVIWALSFLFSYVNPNKWDIFVHLMSTRFFTQNTMHVVEMLPTFRLYFMKMVPVDYPYIIFLSFSVLSVCYFRKTGLTQLLLLVAFVMMSITSYRYLIFYMCISAPIVARALIFLSEEKVCAKLLSYFKVKEGIIYVAVSVIGILLIINASVSLAGFRLTGNEFFMFPNRAVDFLKDVKIEGNMFNEYGFGGYLVWSLFPAKKAFIDSRSLDPAVTLEYRIVAFARENSFVSWKDIMKKYNISYVVTRPLWQNGKIMPIVEELLYSDDWALVYADHLAMIFVRRGSGNSSVINIHEIEKEKGMNTIIAQASAWAMTPQQGNPNYFITLGKTFFRMGKLDQAEKAFMMAYLREPDNQELEHWMQKIETLKKRTVPDSDEPGE